MIAINPPLPDLHSLRPLVESLEGYGERPAIITLQRETAEEWSYARLAEQVRRLGSGLVGRRIGPGQPIALMAGNRPEWVAACLAIISAGAVPVPLDVQLGEDLLQHVLRDCGARLIFTTTDQTERLQKLNLDVAVEPILLDSDENDPRSWTRLLTDGSTVRDPQQAQTQGGGGQVQRRDRPEPRPDDLAALFYTSGTTGPPKGVPLSHANLAHQLNVLRNARLLGGAERLLLPLPLHHIYPFVMGMLGPLWAGMPIVMPKSLTGPQLVRALREGRVTMMVGVPRLYRALHDGIEARARSSGRVARAAFRASSATSTWLVRHLGLRVGKLLLRPVHKQFGPELRLLASGGAALDEELAWKLQGLGWQLATGYGLTETSPLLTLDLPDSAKPGTVGRPISGVELRIDTSVVPEKGASPKEKAGQDEGEIVARGPSVFKGYRNLPDKTREAFTDDGFFRTGDLGLFDEEGYLRVTGRVSTMIVTEGGKHVQPDDLEEIYAQSPVIRELAVLQKDKKLVALVVPETAESQRHGGSAKGDDAVRQAMGERAQGLPSYQHLVDYAVTPEALPRTRLGKVRRGEIEERYDRAKEGKNGSGGAQRGPVAPEEMSAEDRALLENPAAKATWDWLAERYKDQRLGPDMNMQLELGVDSLEWLNLTLEIGQRTGVELSDEAIGNIETVRDLLREMSEAEAGGRAGPPPLERPEEVLSDRQKRWLDPLTPTLAALARWGYALVRALIGSIYRLRINGRENLPPSGPFILAPNHNSYLDPLAVAATLDDPVLPQIYWAGATEVMFRSRILRFISRLAQVTPVDPKSGVRSSLAFAATVLKRGKSLVWFAEGQRSPSGQLQPFKPGIGMLLERYPVPVVPVFIQGTHEALPVGSWLPHRQQITVTIGAPLDVRELQQRGQGESPQQRIADSLHDRVAELAATASGDGSSSRRQKQPHGDGHASQHC